MDEAKTYIVEIPRVVGDETTIYLEADGSAVKSLFAIVETAQDCASIVDNGYRTIDEAKSEWPDAIPPKPFHLTPNAIDENCTIDGQIHNRKLKPR